jgi:guanine nucleotide-binding protein G(i) subunit alpha
MGNCISGSARDKKVISDAIDEQIEEDSHKFRKECKILLLGASTHFICFVCLFW